MSRYIDIEPYEKDGWYLQKTYWSIHGAGIKTTPLKSVPTADIEPIKQNNVKNELLAKIVNNSPTCRNCDIYRDAWNMCFMASECLTNGFKFCKRRKDEAEE